MSIRSCLWVTAILIYSRPFFQEDGNSLKDDDFKYTSFNKSTWIVEEYLIYVVLYSVMT